MAQTDLFAPAARTVLSFGGGKDSTALVAIDLDRDRAAELLGITRANLDAAFPRPDAIVFSDPGAEFPETYENVARVQRLAGDRFHLIRREGETITDWCMRLGVVPVMPGGAHICSKKWKGDVLAAWAAETFPGDDLVWQIGIEADEGYRAKRFTAPKGDAATYRYPLIDLGLDRARIDRLLHDLGWGDIHKSSCVFCPFMGEDEIRDLYVNSPEAWALCRELEARFREESANKHGAWLAAGQPLNAGGRAPRGMWRKDSWAEGARLFVKRIGGRQLSLDEWEARFTDPLAAKEAA